MNSIDIEKLFSEVGRLHVQIMILSEENQSLHKQLSEALDPTSGHGPVCKPASGNGTYGYVGGTFLF